MKMVTAGDTYGFLNICVPFETAMSFDNASFLVRERETLASAVLPVPGITPDVVGETIRPGAELIISHHPVIFQPSRRMGPQDAPYLLAQHGIRTIYAHTNLDLTLSGVDTCLAEASDLEDIHGAKPCGTNELWESLIGNLPRRSSLAESAEYAKQALNYGGLKYVDGGEPVQTVVLRGNAGADLLEDAVQAGADTFIMADIKHHRLLLAE